MEKQTITRVSNMPVITVPDLADIVKYTMLQEDKVPFIWGGPGIGKTEVIGTTLEENGAVLCDVRLGQQDTVDMRGLPVHDRIPTSPTFGQTVWMPPSMLPFVGNTQWPTDRPIGLIFDEANHGSQQVMGNAYQITDERRMGEFVLMPNVKIILMGNLEGQGSIANKVPAALCNRLCHFELQVDVEQFCAYALQQGLPRWLIAYWLQKREVVNTFNPDRPGEKLFATPRTWFMFAKFAMADMPDRIKTISCQASVGRGLAMEALAYRDSYGTIPTMKQIVADPRNTAIPDTLDRQYMVAVNCSATMSVKNAKPIYAYLRRMPRTLTILAFTMAAKRDETLSTSDEFINFGVDYREAFRAGDD